MRKFTVTTIMRRDETDHRIMRPSKAIQLGDLIEFKFSTDTVKAVVKLWDGQKACNECVLCDKNDKSTRCIRFKDSDGYEILLCNACKGENFVFASIDDLMEEV